MVEPESLILQLLRDMRSAIADVGAQMMIEFADVRKQMATKDDISEVKSRIADVASDLLATRKELGEQIVGMRRGLIEYHTSVIGHGVLISELEARLRRVEQHLNLAAPESH